MKPIKYSSKLKYEDKICKHCKQATLEADVPSQSTKYSVFIFLQYFDQKHFLYNLSLITFFITI